MFIAAYIVQATISVMSDCVTMAAAAPGHFCPCMQRQEGGACKCRWTPVLQR